MSNRRVVAEAAFGLGPFDDLTAASWTDLGDVWSADWGIGRDDEFDAYAAQTGEVIFDNRDRRFDPDNLSSPLVGELLPRVPVRIRSVTQGAELNVPGTSGDYLSTPHVASLGISGDIDIRGETRLVDWTPGVVATLVNDFDHVANRAAYMVQVDTLGQLRIVWTTDGTLGTIQSHNSTAAVTVPADGWLSWKVTLDVNVGGTTKEMRFYTAATRPTSESDWVQLGSTVSVAGTSSIHVSNRPLIVGGFNTGTAEPPTGRFRWLEIRNGINGTIVANPDFTTEVAGATTFGDGVGLTWTTTGAASLIAADVYDDEFYGYVTSGWQQLPTATSNDCRLELVDLLGAIHLELPDVFEHAVLAHDPVGFWILDSSEAEQVVDLGSGRNDGTVQGEGVSLGDKVITPGHRPAARFEVTVTPPTDDEDTEQITYGSVYMGRSPIIGTDATSLQNALLMVTFLARKAPANEAATSAEARTLFIQGNGTTGWLKGNGLAALIIQPTGFAATAGMLMYGVQSTITACTLQTVVDGRPHLMFGNNETLALDSATLSAPQTFAYVLPKVNGVGIGGGPGLQPLRHFDGWIGAAALFTSATAVGVAGRQAILDAYSKLDGLRSDEHITWALDVLGIPAAMRNLDEGTVLMGAADTKGKDALGWIREVVATEQGEFYVDHRDSGKLRFRHRYARHLDTRSTTVQATFDDRPNIPGTIPYSPDGLDLVPNSLDSVINTATVTWRDGEVTHTDDTSVAANGPQPRSVDTVATTANQARSVAEWLVARRKDPASQVRGCVASQRAMYDRNDKLQALEVGDRVSFRIQPGNTGTVTTFDLWVEGFAHSCREVEWETSVQFSPADTFVPWVWGTGAWGTTAYWG